MTALWTNRTGASKFLIEICWLCCFCVDERDASSESSAKKKNKGTVIRPAGERPVPAAFGCPGGSGWNRTKQGSGRIDQASIAPPVCLLFNDRNPNLILRILRVWIQVDFNIGGISIFVSRSRKPLRYNAPLQFLNGLIGACSGENRPCSCRNRAYGKVGQPYRTRYRS